MKNIISILFAMLFITYNMSGQNLYVSVNGSDDNPGTPELPFATIQHAADLATAGTTVYVSAGTYSQNITLDNKFGTDLQPISFIAQGTVIIDGGGVNAAQHSNLWYVHNCAYVSLEGFIIQNMMNTDVRGIMIGNNSDNITVKNCIIRNIHWSSNASAAPAPTDNSHPFIALCDSSTQPITNLTLMGNQIYNCRTGYSEGMTINGNVNGFTVSQNIIHDISNIGICAAGNKPWGASSAPATNHARGGFISGNTVYACAFPGIATAQIYVDGGWNIVIERNTIRNGNVGIAVNCESPGTTEQIIVRSNFIYGNSQAGIIMGSSSSAQNVINCSVIGNTTFGNDTLNDWKGELIVYYCENTAITNNIFYATNPKNRISFYQPGNGPGNTIDYNLYYSTTGVYEFVYSGLPYYSLSSLQAASGKDLNSIISNPQFINLTGPDLHLQSNSPAINSGNPNLIATWLDYDGESRIIGPAIDRGADEFDSLGLQTSKIEALVYPNPSQDVLYVEIPDLQTFNYTIYNLTGQIIVKSICNNGRIDTQGLRTGVYFLRIESAKVSVIRFIKL